MGGRESIKMYKLYTDYWCHQAEWAGDSIIKQQMTVVGIPLLIQVTLGAFFTLADLGYIKWFEKIKIQSKKKIPVDKEKMMDAIKIAIRNVLGLSLLCDPFIMKITELRGNIFDQNVPPPMHFLFYVTHRILHTKMFYERIHKFHHQVSSEP